MKTLKLVLLSLLLAGPLIACGDDGGSASPDPDSGAPSLDVGVEPVSATIKSLASHDGVQGTVTVETLVEGEPSKVELLVDGQVVAEATAAPFAISWDSTTATDGIVKLTVKAHGAADSKTSDELPVIVYNQGEMAQFLTASEVLMSVPKTGTAGHKKFNYSMPEGYSKQITVLTWDARSFQMDLAVGVGNCPGSGTMAAQKVSKTSPLVVVYESKAGAFAKGLWFAHLAVANVDDVRGQSTKVVAKTYLLK